MVKKKELISKDFGKNSGRINDLRTTVRFQRFFLTLALILIFCLFIYFGFFDRFLFFSSDKSCGDGTFNLVCSTTLPFYCDNGVLVEKATICGCPLDSKKRGEGCFSDYQVGSKNIALDYTLRGENGKIYFTVYSGLVDYISNLSKFSSNQSREYFKQRDIEDEEQRKLLLPLVKKIQNIADNPDDQARIAISLVQNIPYNESDKTVSFFGADTGVRYSRYPYEVLYDGYGVCGEKSELLAVLLEELGYGYVLYYYPDENHEAFGIRCPNKYSREGDGYCFIETTGPSIITNDQNDYENIGGPLVSSPSVIYGREGKVFGKKNLYEYGDALNWIKLNKLLSLDGGLNVFRKFSRDSLKEKYGLQ